jgi:hypothetical protein
MTKISNQYSLTNILTADLANSRLGINNVSPTVALDVTGAARISGAINLGSSAVFPTVGLFNRTSDTTLYMVTATSGFALLDSSLNSMYGATPTSHIWNISNSEKMRITSAGNVGIGNTGNSSRKLEVTHPTGYSAGIRIIAETGPGDAKIQFFGGGSSQMDIGPTAASPNDLIFGAGGSERMRILSSGLFKLTQETNSRCGVQIKKFTVAVSSSTAVTFTPTDFGLGETGQYHLEIDGGAYGSNSSGAGVYKLVYGGYSNTAGNNATAVIANVMTNGSWGWSISGSTHTITITNSSATMPKDGIIRFTVTYTGA